MRSRLPSQLSFAAALYVGCASIIAVTQYMEVALMLILVLLASAQLLIGTAACTRLTSLCKGRVHYYLLRPEAMEAMFVMWRVTKQEKYRSWAW